MNCFLVDYENVHTDGLRGILSLSKNDMVVIFYSENAETMTFGLHRRLNESEAKIDFQKVSVGSKNALDFQLCTYLGYLIGRNGSSGAVYYIVSSDQDYAPLVGYWARQKVSVSLIPEISAVPAPPKPSAPPKKPETVSVSKTPKKPEAVPANPSPKKADISIKELQTRLKPLLPKKYQTHIPAIAQIIRNGRTKQAVHSDLMKAFHQGADTRIPEEIYQSVKPLLLSDEEYLRVRLESVLPLKYWNDIPAIAEIIRRCPTKQAVNGELIRAFHRGADNSKPTEIYRCVKPLLADKA